MVFDPVKFRKNTLSLAIVFVIAVAALGLRIYLLHTVELHLDADESIVGLMGKHISEGEPVPFFFYGQHYGGGHVIEALAAAAWRKVSAEPSAAAVQAAPVFFSILVLFLVFFITRLKAGTGPAYLAVLMAGFSTPFVKSSLKADGYIETIFFGLLAFTLLAWSGSAAGNKRAGRAGIAAALAGVSLSIAVWSYDFAVLYLAVGVISALPLARRAPARLILFFAGIGIGAIPLIFYNMNNGFAHWEHLISGGPGGLPEPAQVLSNLRELFSHYLPAFFSSDCVHNFAIELHWYSWAVFAAVIISLIYVSFFRPRLILPFAAVPVIVIILFSVSGYFGRSPRYLLPMEPFISICVAIAAYQLYSAKKILFKIAGFSLILIFFTGVFLGYPNLLRDDSIVEGNVKTNPESLVQAVSVLNDHDIKCVFTTYFIKWRILFLSDEKINAIDTQSGKRAFSYNRYEQMGCPPGETPGIVLHQASPYISTLPSVLEAYSKSVKIIHTHDHIILIPVPSE